jgi:membrane fusion protein, multidrug efflux system
VEAYKAQLDQARLNVAYCHVVAPVSGIVMQRSAETGARIAVGTQLLVVAQIDQPWVTANFKETQLRKMHPGQHVSVKIDALDESFKGIVESMPASTGDRASVLPAENATGNFVKVIERLPVRIRLDKGQKDLDKVRPGMSVEPKVSLD